MTESSTERAAGRPIAFNDVRVGDTIERRWTSRGIAYGVRGLLLIDRPKPPLPIEVGSVIVNATIRGVPGQVATLVETYGGQFWRTSGTLAGVYAHDPEHITEWTLGKVVPA